MYLPGELAVRGDVAGSTTLGAEGGVGNTALFCALPWAQDPDAGRGGGRSQGKK